VSRVGRPQARQARYPPTTSVARCRPLSAHPAFREVDEVAFALPFTFEHDDYTQILTDIATGLGPALGWRPTR
jgi:hypothetical protein